MVLTGIGLIFLQLVAASSICSDSLSDLIPEHRVFFETPGTDRYSSVSKLLEAYEAFAEKNVEKLSAETKEWGPDKEPAIYFKWIFYRGKKTTADEIIWIFSDDERAQVFKTGVWTYTAALALSLGGYKLLQYWQIEGFPMHSAAPNIPWWKRAGWFSRDSVHEFARMILPWPTGTKSAHKAVKKILSKKAHRWILSPTRWIFRDLYSWPKNRELTPEKIELLEQYGLMNEYQKKADFLQKHPRLRALTWSLHQAANTARLATLVGIFTLYGLAAEGPIEANEYLNNSAYRPADNEIQIIMDTAPFPHTSIRTGNSRSIYSYGQTHVTRSEDIFYLYGRQIRETFIQDPNEGSMASFQLDKIISLTGLDRLDRTLTIITIEATEEQVRELSLYLSEQEGKRYMNTTFVNDCNTMNYRALRNIGVTLLGPCPQLIDASPGQTAMLHGIQEVLGASNISRVELVRINPEGNDLVYRLRNAWIHQIESHLFISFFLLHQPWRTALDILRTEDELSNHEPGFREGVEVLEQESKHEFNESAGIRLLRARMKRYLEVGATNEQLDRFESKIKSELEVLESQYKSIVASSVEDWASRVKANHFLNMIMDEKTSLLAQVQNLRKQTSE